MKLHIWLIIAVCLSPALAPWPATAQVVAGESCTPILVRNMFEVKGDFRTQMAWFRSITKDEFETNQMSILARARAYVPLHFEGHATMTWDQFSQIAKAQIDSSGYAESSSASISRISSYVPESAIAEWGACMRGVLGAQALIASVGFNTQGEASVDIQYSPGLIANPPINKLEIVLSGSCKWYQIGCREPEVISAPAYLQGPSTYPPIRIRKNGFADPIIVSFKMRHQVPSNSVMIPFVGDSPIVIVKTTPDCTTFSWHFPDVRNPSPRPVVDTVGGLTYYIKLLGYWSPFDNGEDWKPADNGLSLSAQRHETTEISSVSYSSTGLTVLPSDSKIFARLDDSVHGDNRNRPDDPLRATITACK